MNKIDDLQLCGSDKPDLRSNPPSSLVECVTVSVYDLITRIVELEIENRMLRRAKAEELFDCSKPAIASPERG